MSDSYEKLAAQKAAIVAKDMDDNANPRTVMTAAAEEIQRCWSAHVDAEGYGPANLMRRLEQGVPAFYTYKAGDFAQMKTRIAELEAQLAEARELLTEIRDNEVNAQDEADKYLRNHDKSELSKVRVALEAAQKDAKELARIAELEAQLVKAEKDAARYHHLRCGAYETVIPHGNTLNGKRTAWIALMHTGETFEEAIDAAIAKEQSC